MKAKSIAMMVLLQAFTPALDIAQAQQTPAENSQASMTSPEPQAIVLQVRGRCEYSQDGSNFIRLKEFKEGDAVRSSPPAEGISSEIGFIGGATISVPTPTTDRGVRQAWGRLFKGGTVIRTGEHALVDIFFRGTGTTVRLQPGTEMKIEKMTRLVKDGRPVESTLLDLNRGGIFAIVRSYVPGSKFEIKNAAGRAVVEGGGANACYLITADASQGTSAEFGAASNVNDKNGLTVVVPGQKFPTRIGEPLPLEPTEAESTLIQFDQLHALTGQ